MEGIKLDGLEISFTIDNVSAEQFKNSINYMFSDIINVNKQIDINHKKNTSNNQIESNNASITDKQMKYIHALAKEKELYKSVLKNYSISMFGKVSGKDLTIHEASQLIAVLNNL